MFEEFELLSIVHHIPGHCTPKGSPRSLEHFTLLPVVRPSRCFVAEHYRLPLVHPTVKLPFLPPYVFAAFCPQHFLGCLSS